MTENRRFLSLSYLNSNHPIFTYTKHRYTLAPLVKSKTVNTHAPTAGSLKPHFPGF